MVLGLCAACLLGAAVFRAQTPRQFAFSPAFSPPVPEPDTLVWTAAVVNRFPHDPRAFTQGLVYANGLLYESTGLYGKSSLREVDLATGRVQGSRSLPENEFGEGLALRRDTLIQLTWKNSLGRLYRRTGLEPGGTFAYPRALQQGWGAACDGRWLWVSDGSSRLLRMDPETFAVTGRMDVCQGRRRVPVRLINELEFYRDRLLANVWRTTWIVCINPDDGRVIGWIDLAPLAAAETHSDESVPNGIAWDREGDRLLVTGKCWRYVYQIRLDVRTTGP